MCRVEVADPISEYQANPSRVTMANHDLYHLIQSGKVRL